jgi:hypothetical protein
MEEPCFDKTNVPIARRLATGRMNAPAARDQRWSLTRLLQERRQDGNLNQRARTSLVLQELSQTRLLTTRLPRAHGRNESGGSTNALHGGH